MNWGAKLFFGTAVLIVTAIIGLATLGLVLKAAGYDPDRRGVEPSPTTTQTPVEEPSWTYWMIKLPG